MHNDKKKRQYCDNKPDCFEHRSPAMLDHFIVPHAWVTVKMQVKANDIWIDEKRQN
ncbi:hypothetical protein [Methylocystis sp. ATCC 49242]|uniref:hypothetical protein n=1 Tax=Methylocystis sp. ATCC 49242 TaxID=622637 RepID=UPI00130E143C|nr:hypothetical protein [Methylocystis sp. ATCC 49242]